MAANQKDPVKEFFEDFITHESCKLHLIEISDKYMRASCLHDREWEDEKVRSDANRRKSMPQHGDADTTPRNEVQLNLSICTPHNRLPAPHTHVHAADSSFD